MVGTVHPRLSKLRLLLLDLPNLRGSWRSGELSNPQLQDWADFRNLLAVEPKNLDADAELRRFFGSKVVCPPSPKSLSLNYKLNFRYRPRKPQQKVVEVVHLQNYAIRSLNPDRLIHPLRRLRDLE
jgi:hypothetical protein